MALCVAGNVEVNEVLKVVDDALKPTSGTIPENIFPQEPYEVVKNRIEQKFPVSMPAFQLGFKEDASKGRPTIEESTQTDIILYLLSTVVTTGCEVCGLALK